MIKNNNSLTKLNLGCGDKIIPDYINVDIASERKGLPPDVICDITNLSIFEDNYADEILAVHVIEHFWFWDVPTVLAEWFRVLKPGGILILECPNLRSACEYFLANPATSFKSDINGQRSMWVFYGDPSWKDEKMMHRWGYTPESLIQVLSDAGFSSVRQEAAVFKLREPRDMRIVGIKPTKKLSSTVIDVVKSFIKF